MTAPTTETLAGLLALRGEVTDEDLNADGRYFCDTSFRDLTQCPHGDTGRYGNDADGKAVAKLWNAWRAGELASAAENAALRERVAEMEGAGWQPIETAPRDGTKIDLWGINHLHYAKKCERLVNTSWGPVTDWIGGERLDWKHGRGEGFEPTHWMPLPAPPSADLNPTEGVE